MRIEGADRAGLGRLLIFPRLDSCRTLAGLGQDADVNAIVGSQPVRAFFAGLLPQVAPDVMAPLKRSPIRPGSARLCRGLLTVLDALGAPARPSAVRAG